MVKNTITEHISTIVLIVLDKLNKNSYEKYAIVANRNTIPITKKMYWALTIVISIIFISKLINLSTIESFISLQFQRML